MSSDPAPPLGSPSSAASPSPIVSLTDAEAHEPAASQSESELGTSGTGQSTTTVPRQPTGARLGLVDGVLTVRPRKIRKVAWVLAPIVVVCFVVLGFLLSGAAMEGDAPFGTGDRVAMMTLGLFAAAAILLLARPKLVADADHLKITNVIGGYDLPWSVIKAVRFDHGHAWVNLELENDDVVGVMAIQATDKDYALAAVRTLRAMLATHAPAAPTSPTPTAT